MIRFQFTHPGRGATQERPTPRRHGDVSIHAPREGCDAKPRTVYVLEDVSIHAPREGCDTPPRYTIAGFDCFNSRTPGGVRRPAPRLWGWGGLCFNSRTPGGVRLEWEDVAPLSLAVSIHAPREGCDGYFDIQLRANYLFQFTHPGRGATVWCKVAYYRADKQA